MKFPRLGWLALGATLVLIGGYVLSARSGPSFRTEYLPGLIHVGKDQLVIDHDRARWIWNTKSKVVQRDDGASLVRVEMGLADLREHFSGGDGTPLGLVTGDRSETISSRLDAHPVLLTAESIWFTTPADNWQDISSEIVSTTLCCLNRKSKIRKWQLVKYADPQTFRATCDGRILYHTNFQYYRRTWIMDQSGRAKPLPDLNLGWEVEASEDGIYAIDIPGKLALFGNNEHFLYRLEESAGACKWKKLELTVLWP